MIRQEIRFYGNVQGNPETIEKLISRIEERPFIIIENMDVKENKFSYSGIS